jgi:hypothetical protein
MHCRDRKPRNSLQDRNNARPTTSALRNAIRKANQATALVLYTQSASHTSRWYALFSGCTKAISHDTVAAARYISRISGSAPQRSKR